MLYLRTALVLQQNTQENGRIAIKYDTPKSHITIIRSKHANTSLQHQVNTMQVTLALYMQHRPIPMD